MQKLKHGTVTLAHEESGAGDATPMLFVHGWGCNHSYFGPQQAFFARTGRTVAVDLRGHGASDAPHQDYTVAGFADDLVWQCHQLEIAKPIVIGHSMGGIIALEFAARHPNLSAAVVLIDSYLIFTPPVPEAVLQLFEELGGPNYTSALEQAVAPLFTPSDDPSVREAFVAALAATPRHVLVSSFASALIDYDAAAAAAACRVPIAYIGAEATLTDLSRFKQLCPQLKVAQTLGSGHFSPLIVPEQINAMLQGFERAYLRH
jgi:pimeloyl-ACP methyl ester carboxylesterase